MTEKATVLSSKEVDSVFKLLKPGRDQLIFAIGLYTGLRISEILSLQQKHVFSDSGGIKNDIIVERLKKRKPVYDTISVHHKLRPMLKEYRAIVSDSHWLFPSSQSLSGHLSREQAHKILKEVFNTLRIERGKTHSMRRTCLTYLHRAGVDLRTIQEISGHRDLRQLQEYLDVDPEDTRKAINKIKY